MKNPKNERLTLIPAALLAALLSACVADSNDEASSGTSTHFLDECDDSASCGDGLSCICGRCTQECEESRECEELDTDSVCAAATALQGECSGTRQMICLSAALSESEPENDAGMSESEPTTVPSEPVTSEPTSEPDPTTSEPGPSDAGPSEPDPTTSEPNDPGTTEPGTGDSDTNDAGTSDAGTNEPAPTQGDGGTDEPDPVSNDAGSEPSPNLRCTEVTDPPSAMCAPQVCYPDVLDVSAYEADAELGFACTAYVGVEACGGAPDYQAFEYQSDELTIYVSFDASVADAPYTPEAFAAGFEYMWLNVYLPNADGLQFMRQSDSLNAGDPRIKALTYQDGRLKGRVELGDLERVTQHIESNEDTCFSGDIAGECFCDYEIDPLPTTIEFDLPIEGG